VDFLWLQSPYGWKTEKARRGRPNHVLRIRLTEEERRVLDEAAQARTLDTSTWARAELLALARRAPRKKGD